MVDILGLGSDFSGNCLSFSPVSMKLAMGLLCIAFIMLRYILSNLLEIFILRQGVATQRFNPPNYRPFFKSFFSFKT